LLRIAGRQRTDRFERAVHVRRDLDDQLRGQPLLVGGIVRDQQLQAGLLGPAEGEFEGGDLLGSDQMIRIKAVGAVAAGSQAVEANSDYSEQCRHEHKQDKRESRRDAQ